MLAGLLYSDRDWTNVDRYEDDKTIITDLNLTSLFHTCSQRVIWKGEHVEKVLGADPYIEKTMRQVIMVPLHTKEEVLYRQAVIRDFLKEPEVALHLYETTSGLINAWNALGRKGKSHQEQTAAGSMMTKIKVIGMLLGTLCKVRTLLEEKQDSFSSEGVRALLNRIHEELPEEKEKNIRKVLEDLSFFVIEENKEEELRPGRVCVPQITLGCRMGPTLRFDEIRVENVESVEKKFHKPGSFLSKVDDYKAKMVPDAIPMSKSPKLEEQGAYVELMMANYLCESLAGFVSEIGAFFDQLQLQSAFLVGVFNLKEQMLRYGLGLTFPTVGEKECFRFKELKELVMCLEQHAVPIGNTCDIQKKNMLIITGANQGGKSTFLRSVGIAQILLQSGMPVLADAYEGPLCPGLYTHFTRREDSEMNSGRLDEELKRMSQIVDFVAKNEAKAPGTSLVLLNESFATTTEKEGSVISYDILQAMAKMGVNVITVTHLLAFAKRMYEEKELEKEEKHVEETNVVFLSAERLENGERTFRMIPCVPQLTSFGLDLYDRMIPQFST